MATILRIKMKQPLKDQVIGGTLRAQSTLVPSTEQKFLDWAEITRYHQLQDQAATQQEKDKALQRKKDVRHVLEAQISQRRQASLEQTQERKRYE
jgi:hypothetical protein